MNNTSIMELCHIGAVVSAAVFVLAVTGVIVSFIKFNIPLIIAIRSGDTKRTAPGKAGGAKDLATEKLTVIEREAIDGGKRNRRGDFRFDIVEEIIEVHTDEACKIVSCILAFAICMSLTTVNGAEIYDSTRGTSRTVVPATSIITVDVESGTSESGGPAHTVDGESGTAGSGVSGITVDGESGTAGSGMPGLSVDGPGEISGEPADEELSHDKTPPIFTGISLESATKIFYRENASYSAGDIELVVKAADAACGNSEMETPSGLAAIRLHDSDGKEVEGSFDEETGAASFLLSKDRFATSVEDAKELVIELEDAAGNISRKTLLEAAGSSRIKDSTAIAPIPVRVGERASGMKAVTEAGTGKTNNSSAIGLIINSMNIADKKNESSELNYFIKSSKVIVGGRGDTLVSVSAEKDLSDVYVDTAGRWWVGTGGIEVVYRASSADIRIDAATAYDTSGRDIAGEFSTEGSIIEHWDFHDSFNKALYLTKHYAFTDSGPHSLSLLATNGVGAEVAAGSTVDFTVDVTTPRVTNYIFMSPKDGSAVLETDYGYFFKDVTQISIEADDADGSGIKSITYWLVDLGGDYSSAREYAITVPADSENRVYFDLPANYKGQIYAYATDCVGNTSEIAGMNNPPARVIVENGGRHGVTSAASITPDQQAPFATADGLPLYPAGTSYTVTVRDTFSGIDLDATTVFVSSNGIRRPVSMTWSETKEENLTIEAVGTVTVDEQSNEIAIAVESRDKAGFAITSQSEKFAIDKAAPVISVSYDDSSLTNVSHAPYFNETRTATVTLTDSNFNPAGTNIRTSGVVSGWSGASDVQSDGTATYSATVVFVSDGDYTLAVDAADRASHRTEDSSVRYSGLNPKSFTVDKTLPKVAISFSDGAEPGNGHYFRADRTATIEIVEHNFRADGAEVAGTAKIEEGNTEMPSLSSWSGSGDRRTAAMVFDCDGDYTLSAGFTDLAGNKAEPVSAIPFTVDKTPPTLDIKGVADGVAYKGGVAPSISYHDINFDPASAGISITGVKNSTGANLAGEASNGKNGGSFTAPNIEVVKANDDVYTITGRVADLAGNVTEKSVTFSVNRFGSTYTFDSATEQFLKDYFADEPQDVVIREINVDELKNHTVTVSNNGESRKLAEGEDYTVTRTGVGWKEYAYTIKADVFNAEGNYDIIITSEDSAGNRNTNRAVNLDRDVRDEVQMRFIIDRTPPAIVIDGVEDGSRLIAGTRDVRVRFEDNIGVSDVDVTLNGSPVILEEKEMQEVLKTGEFPVRISAGNSWQELAAVARDETGNVSRRASARFLLTGNVFVQFVNNPGAMLVTAAVATLGVGLGAFTGHKKKVEKKVKKATRT